MNEINHPQAHFKFPRGRDIENEMRYAIEKKKIPKFLFKYMTIKGALRFLENAELLYSRSIDFNDPFPVFVTGTPKKSHPSFPLTIRHSSSCTSSMPSATSLVTFDLGWV